MGTIRSLRVAPPAHYSIKMQTFSLLVLQEVDRYECNVFEVDGYKWRLCLYPCGRIPGKGHMSLNLVLADTKTLPADWEVSVRFKMFVFDNNKDEYLTVKDANHRVWRYRDKKTEWGFDQFLALDAFNDASNGYLVNDSCEFGVEVFVINYTGKGECISLVKEPDNYACTWKIPDLYELADGENCSEDFTVGGQKWQLCLYHEENGKPRGKYLSLYLKLVESANLPHGQKFYVKYKLAIKNQQTLNHNYENEGGPTWFSAASNIHGFTGFLLLDELNHRRGFTNLPLIVEGKIMVISHVEELISP